MPSEKVKLHCNNTNGTKQHVLVTSYKRNRNYFLSREGRVVRLGLNFYYTYKGEGQKLINAC